METRSPVPTNPLSVEDRETWFGLIDRQIRRLQQSAQRERTEDIERARNVLAEASQGYTEAVEILNGKAAQQRLSQSKLLLRSLIETYGDRPHTNDTVDSAKDLLKAVDTFEKEEGFTQGTQK